MSSMLESWITSFDRLSAKEQVMVVFLVTALLLMSFGFGSYFVNKELKRRQLQVSARSERLIEVGQLQSDYRRRLQAQQAIANEVQANNGTRLLSYLEDMGRRSKVELKNIQERGGQPTGSEAVREEAAEVVIQNVSLDRLYDFLKRLEEGNRLIMIRKLKIKARYDNDKMLDASITVGTFKTTEQS